jgi:hypothetical protein
MAPLPGHGEEGKKYLGGGHGGYALYLFGEEAGRAAFLAGVPGTAAVEPYHAPRGGEAAE